jgi:hypothetical protein
MSSKGAQCLLPDKNQLSIYLAKRVEQTHRTEPSPWTSLPHFFSGGFVAVNLVGALPGIADYSRPSLGRLVSTPCCLPPTSAFRLLNRDQSNRLLSDFRQREDNSSTDESVAAFVEMPALPVTGGQSKGKTPLNEVNTFQKVDTRDIAIRKGKEHVQTAFVA